MKNTKTYTNTQIAIGYGTDPENTCDEAKKNAAMTIIMEVYNEFNAAELPNHCVRVDPIFGWVKKKTTYKCDGKFYFDEEDEEEDN